MTDSRLVTCTHYDYNSWCIGCQVKNKAWKDGITRTITEADKVRWMLIGLLICALSIAHLLWVS